jgi:hypothetical protein
LSENTEKLFFGIVHLEELKVSNGPPVVNFFLPDESFSKTGLEGEHWRILSLSVGLYMPSLIDLLGGHLHLACLVIPLSKGSGN